MICETYLPLCSTARGFHILCYSHFLYLKEYILLVTKSLLPCLWYARAWWAYTTKGYRGASTRLNSVQAGHVLSSLLYGTSIWTVDIMLIDVLLYLWVYWHQS